MNAPETIALSPNQPVKASNPTATLYSEIMQAYQHFNRTLFESKLPECLITLQRKKGRLAMVSMDRFVQAEDGTVFTHEISVNPAYFAHAKPREVLSSLVHEMCRIQINMNSEPDERRSKGYHCKDWGKEMERVGLMPSDTGKPNGKKYGYKMFHYVLEDALFDRSSSALLGSGWKLTWLDRMAEQFDPALMTDADYPEEEDDDSEEEDDFPTDGTQSVTSSGGATSEDEKGNENPSGASAPDSRNDDKQAKSFVEGKGRSQSVQSLPKKTLPSKFNQRPAQRLGKALIAPKANKAGIRQKYVCPGCLAAVWGKPELNILCGKCNKAMPSMSSSQHALDES